MYEMTLTRRVPTLMPAGVIVSSLGAGTAMN